MPEARALRLTALGSLAADTLTRAIGRALWAAESAGGLPLLPRGAQKVSHACLCHEGVLDRGLPRMGPPVRTIPMRARSSVG